MSLNLRRYFTEQLKDTNAEALLARIPDPLLEDIENLVSECLKTPDTDHQSFLQSVEARQHQPHFLRQ